MKIIEAQKLLLKGSKRKKVKATDLIPCSRNNNHIKKTGKGNTFFFYIWNIVNFVFNKYQYKESNS